MRDDRGGNFDRLRGQRQRRCTECGIIVGDGSNPLWSSTPTASLLAVNMSENFEMREALGRDSGSISRNIKTRSVGLSSVPKDRKA